MDKEISARVTRLADLPVGSLFKFSATPGTGTYKNLSTVQLDALRSVCVVVRTTPGLVLVRPVRDFKGLAKYLTGTSASDGEAGAEVWYIGSMGVVGLVVP